MPRLQGGRQRLGPLYSDNLRLNVLIYRSAAPSNWLVSGVASCHHQPPSVKPDRLRPEQKLVPVSVRSPSPKHNTLMRDNKRQNRKCFSRFSRRLEMTGL